MSEADTGAFEARVAQQRIGPRVAGRLRRLSVGTLLPYVVLAVLVFWAAVPGWFGSYDPIRGNVFTVLLPPGPDHWFGTDHLGRDLFARVVHGTRLTMTMAGIAVGIGLVVGIVLGLVAATSGRVVDAAVMRVSDVLLALPGLLIALVLTTSFGAGSLPVAVGVGVSLIPSFARVMRSEVVRVRSLDYVEAAYLGGSGYVKVLFSHVLPNSVGPVLSLVAIDLSAAILAIAGLGFLGYGEPPPRPEWGLLIAEGRSYLGSAWWLTTLPGLVLIVVIVTFSTLGMRILKKTRI
ncbi:ABC transporter permease [Pseudochelatococcus sp. B33]